jgi:Fe2+ or Zn2+ uptake regulation protein
MNQEQKPDLVEVKRYLEQHGVHPSYHRLKIMGYLMEHRTHPTVDIIFQGVSAEIPTLSKTTVYNTLTLFQEKGLASELTIEENEVRYDANITPHAHFKCLMCGSIFDMDLKSSLFKRHMIEGHQVQQCQISFKGICKNCAS